MDGPEEVGLMDKAKVVEVLNEIALFASPEGRKPF